MSGHSKWSSIKHKKAKKDAQRGKLFSKLARKITIEARQGGGDIEKNPGLRMVVEKAQEAGMPKENIKRAIQRGTGELAGVSYEQITCEGYGPGGVAVLVEAVTDNKRRVISEIRHILTSNGGHMGETGCVSWLFERKGSMVFDRENVDEDKIMDLAIEIGAEDIREDNSTIEVIFPPEKFGVVKEKVKKAGLNPDLLELTMVPQTVVPLEEKEAIQMLKLMDALEEMEEVQNVYANFDIPEEIMEKASSG
ncbi:YebC/PmpR family DNA-binding transcriptional regulator [Candidatus Aerophobetes bacterium]|uniref:Probable transcriptional regulatory protein DRJ04_04835 n=1 Tax=Aerophobetes bacterium TaxID=2030807 RepID=A0A662DBK1_UNCAE|nr:MAG: YebC/PmpR family DNA-binding transcriptional regulator [Candidatus Aerophobetes bacterium]